MAWMSSSVGSGMGVASQSGGAGLAGAVGVDVGAAGAVDHRVAAGFAADAGEVVAGLRVLLGGVILFAGLARAYLWLR
jgi:hypothetical protein